MERYPISGPLKSHTPSARQRITNWMNQNMFGDTRQGQGKAERLMGVMDYTPLGVGTAMYDAGRAGAEGNMLGAGLNLAMAGVPGPAKKGIRAFHGSPHDFDKFSLDKIGTGEGAQAYGHGLYFAENEGVARDYRRKLGDYKVNAEQILRKYVGEAELSPEDIASVQQLGSGDGLEKHLAWRVPATRGLTPDQRQAILDEYKTREAGRMYEVSINADPEQFLDWDAPLSQQPEPIRQLGSAQKNRPLVDTDTGRDIYNKNTQGLSSDTASERLKAAGIPGIKYLDQGSRNAGDGTRNYVVFDDKLIEILKKYGLLGPIATGMAASMYGQDDQ